MFVRRSMEADLPRMLEIYSHARSFMKKSGNPLQWGDAWPPQELLEEDIRVGRSYVCVEDDSVVGTFAHFIGEDPTYREIFDGAWIGTGEYGVVHRVASDGSVRGVGTFCIKWALQNCGDLRIDTHGDNIVMQSLLNKLGFTHCGTIYVEEDEYPRLAYEKLEPGEGLPCS